MNKIPEGIQLKISAIGLDNPGLVSFITEKIYKLNGNIIRMEENNQWGLFSIFLIVDFPTSKKRIPHLKSKIKGMEKNTDLKIIVSACEQEDLWAESLNNYIIEISGFDKPGIIANISSILHNYNVNIETAQTFASGDFFSMEMLVNLTEIKIPSDIHFEKQFQNLKRDLINAALDLDQSLVIQKENRFRIMKKLIIFDVEAVLVEKKSLKEFFSDLVKLLKKKKSDKALNLKIHDLEGLINHSKVLKNISVDEIRNLAKKVKFKEDVLDLFQILKEMGYKIALLSSGLSFYLQDLLKKMKVEYAFVNNLKVDDEGVLTGDLEEPVITDQNKTNVIDIILNLEKLGLEKIIAVGDVEQNYMKDVGLSIAYGPQDETLEFNGMFNSNLNLKFILYCLGIPKTQLEKYFPH